MIQAIRALWWKFYWAFAAPEPAAEHGCCGCGTPVADVLTEPWAGAPRGEGYCWACHDRSPIVQAAVARVFPGHER